MRLQQSYDHRLRDLVRSTGSVHCATKIGVPRSTAASWIKRPAKPVVSATSIANDELMECERELHRLRSQVARLRLLIRLLFVILKLSGFKLEYLRVPDGFSKQKLLVAIKRASDCVPLVAILKVIGLSRSRYYAWNQADHCELTDLTSCPRIRPAQFTRDEIAIIQDMVTCKNHRHINTGGLARIAQRTNMVFASTGSWYRLARKYGWKRPRNRIYPPKPKIGIRAKKPNEIWHIDTSIVRLLDGGRAYLHAIIDNFSRKILAWQVNGSFNANATVELLEKAASGLPKPPPDVFMDSGIENTNSTVTAMVENGTIARVLAQVDVVFSNSMIESWWRSLKHQWLYLNTLDSVETVCKLVEFYVEQHNKVIPHSAFKDWQTPDEMYFGKGSEVHEHLKASRLKAKLARREANLAVQCARCQTEPKLVQLANEQNNSS